MKKHSVFIMVIIFIIILSFVCFKYYCNYRKITRLEQRLASVREEIEEAEERNKELKKQLENLNDLDYVERIARKKLGLVKPGEVLLIPVEERQE